MLTIFLMYSPDRRKELNISIECLKDMELIRECQKIICVDGNEPLKIENFEVVNVHRPSTLFNWAAIWQAALNKAKYEKILYLDCDRILPNDYLVNLNKILQNDLIVYSSNLYRFKEKYDLKTIKMVKDNPGEYRHFYEVDPRLPHPPNLKFVSLGKNPISGNTGITKKTYYKLGGIDPEFEGWGFPDTDFYLRAIKTCKFLTIKANEFHLKHDYAVNSSILKLMNLWNALKVARKHNMNLDNNLKNRFTMLKITQNEISRFKKLDKLIVYYERKTKKWKSFV